MGHFLDHNFLILVPISKSWALTLSTHRDESTGEIVLMLQPSWKVLYMFEVVLALKVSFSVQFFVVQTFLNS